MSASRFSPFMRGWLSHRAERTFESNPYQDGSWNYHEWVFGFYFSSSVLQHRSVTKPAAERLLSEVDRHEKAGDFGSVMTRRDHK